VPPGESPTARFKRISTTNGRDSAMEGFLSMDERPPATITLKSENKAAGASMTAEKEVTDGTFIIERIEVGALVTSTGVQLAADQSPTSASNTAPALGEVVGKIRIGNVRIQDDDTPLPFMGYGFGQRDGVAMTPWRINKGTKIGFEFKHNANVNLDAYVCLHGYYLVK
jgi:hypothetical protein